MLRTRVLVGLVLMPFCLAAIFLGGWVFAALIAITGAIAGLEFSRLFRAGGHTPLAAGVAVGCAALALARQLWGFDHNPLVISTLVLVFMTVSLFKYEYRGDDRAATDFAISLAGVFYIGWLGAYSISIRNLPEGVGWLLAALVGVWSADSFAYLVGVRFGRHKLAPRLSPKKTWEGFAGGVVGAVALAAAWAALWAAAVSAGWVQAGLPGAPGAASALTPLRGALLGLVMGVFPVLGDLGESMVKRQFGVKDSGKILPGHGGVFDRIDSWLWALVLAYYLIQVWI